VYNGPIIDTHHHLWDLTLRKHPWLIPGNKETPLVGLEKLGSIYLPEHYVADAKKYNLIASVHIEALWDPTDPVGETRWLETLDKSNGVAVRYVVAAPLGTPEAGHILREQASFSRVVGVRAILSHHPDSSKSFAPNPRLAYDKSWRNDVALLEKLGLHLELMMYPYQAQAVADLANTFPGLQIIINHCGSPIDRDAKGMQRWRDGLKQIATHQNIAIKASTPGAYDPDGTSKSIGSVILECIQAFGIARCMFGSDYPVTLMRMPLDKNYRYAKEATANLSPQDQRAFFHDNAKRFYRM